MIRYAGTSPAAGEWVLASDGAGGSPRFRLSYKLGAGGVLAGRFEMAKPPNPEAFDPYLTWTARRKGRQD